jgi:hypothetical protein
MLWKKLNRLKNQVNNENLFKQNKMKSFNKIWKMPGIVILSATLEVAAQNYPTPQPVPTNPYPPGLPSPVQPVPPPGVKTDTMSIPPPSRPLPFDTMGRSPQRMQLDTVSPPIPKTKK